MNVTKLIEDLIKIRDAGGGDAQVVIEETGLGYAAPLVDVNTWMTDPNGGPGTLTLLGEVMDPDRGYDVAALKQLAYGDVDKGVRPLDLDNAVNEAAEGQASNVNVSGGIDGQVDFLVQMLGYFEAQTLIHDAAKAQRN